MQLNEIIWKDRFVDKIEVKHGVLIEEVEEILFDKPHIRRIQKGHNKMRRFIRRLRTNGFGTIFDRLFYPQKTAVMPISVRDMTNSERKYYARQAEAIDQIPEEFAGYEEAAEFWDTHDTTDYPESFETVSAQTELKNRRYEIEIDADLMPVLTKQAQSRGVKVGNFVSEFLREKMRPAA